MPQPSAKRSPLQDDTAVPHDTQGTDTADVQSDDILIFTAAAETSGSYLDMHDGLQLMRC